MWFFWLLKSIQIELFPPFFNRISNMMKKGVNPRGGNIKYPPELNILMLSMGVFFKCSSIFNYFSIKITKRCAQILFVLPNIWLCLLASKTKNVASFVCIFNMWTNIAEFTTLPQFVIILNPPLLARETHPLQTFILHVFLVWAIYLYRGTSWNPGGPVAYFLHDESHWIHEGNWEPSKSRKQITCAIHWRTRWISLPV